MFIFASDYAQPAKKDITIRNSSSKPIAIKAVRYGSYHFFTDVNKCGDTIPANSECDIGVGYIPLNNGDSSVNAKMSIDFDRHSSIIIDLIGVNESAYVGTEAPKINIINGGLLIKQPDEGGVAEAKLILKNNDELPHNFISAESLNGKNFIVTGSSCGLLKAGESCAVTVRYNATVDSYLESDIIVRFDNSFIIGKLCGATNIKSYIANVDDTTLTPVQFEDDNISVIAEELGEPSVAVLKLFNPRKTLMKNVTVELNRGDFSYHNGCSSILPNNFCSILLFYTPKNIGTVKGEISVVFDGGSVTKDFYGVYDTGSIINFSYRFPSFLSAEFTPKLYEIKGMVKEYKWLFGDKAVSRESTPTHTYKDAGVYPVTLIVLTESGKTYARTRSVKILDSLIADFAVDVNGRDVTLLPHSIDKTGKNISYEWDFGDGVKSKDHMPSHRYAKAGRYAVRMIAVNSAGAFITLSKSVEIE